MYPHTKSEIPTLHNIENAPNTISLELRPEVNAKVTVTLEQNVTLHNTKMYPLTNNLRYTIFLDLRPDVKDIVTQKPYASPFQRSTFKFCMFIGHMI